MSEERIQKILAAAGVASRRKAEELIAAGRISVNGETITTLGSKADPRADEIRVDGALVGSPERHVYFMVYKPKGVMTTVSDPEGRPTVMELVPGIKERIFPVGRLDYLSEGLLLMTNDGGLMAKLTHAKSHVAKTYMVKVSGHPTDAELDKLREGITLPPEPSLTGAHDGEEGVKRRSFSVHTLPAKIELAREQENPWYEVTLTEGRNRQIRRMFKEVGYHVEKIKRIRYATLELNVEPGEVRPLTVREVNDLKKSLEEKPVYIAPPVKAEAEVESTVEGEEPKPRVYRAATPRYDGKGKDFRSPAQKVQSRYERPGSAVRRSEKFISKTTSEDEQPRGRYSRGSGVGGFDGRPGASDERPKRPYIRREEGSSDRPSRPYVRRDGGDEERPRRSYTPRPAEGGFDRPARKPFVRRDAEPGRIDDSDQRTRRRTFDADGKPVAEERRTYAPRPSAPRSYAKRSDEGSDRPKRPYVRREEGGDRPSRPYVRREGGSSDRPSRPYVRREGAGEDRPRRNARSRMEASSENYMPLSGVPVDDSDRPARPYVRREGGDEDRPRRTYTPRPSEGGFDRPKRPYVRREGGPSDRPARPYVRREGSDRPSSGRPSTGRPSYGGAARSGARPSFGSKPGFGAKPRFGARPGFGARPNSGESRGKAPYRAKSFDAPREGSSDERRGPAKSFGEKKSFGARTTLGAKKGFGGPKVFGEKKRFGTKKSVGGKSFGAKKSFGGPRSSGSTAGRKPGAGRGGKTPYRKG